MKVRPFAQPLALALLLTLAPFSAGSQPSGEKQERPLWGRIDSLLSSAYPPDGPGAAVIVVRDGQVLLRKGYGLADLELGVPIEPDMVFRIASLTKEFTAALILQLVEEGVLSLDDKVTKFLPEYPVRGHEVTIEHLLTHTSGIPTFQQVSGFQDHVRVDHTVDETIAIFANEPLEFPPGERYSYSSSGYILLGAILERATGKTYEELLQERIFDVTGMKSAQLGNHDRITPGRVRGYTVSNGTLINMPLVTMTMAFSSGGLLMSVDDLARWDDALYGDQVLGEASREAMWSPHTLPNGQVTEYGFGWMVTEFLGHRVLMHDGSLDGFLSAAWRLPDEHLFVAVLTNSDSPRVGPNMAAKEVLAVLLGFPEREAIPVTAAELAPYTGDYKRTDGRVWRVTEEDGRLFVAPNQNVRWEIRPESETDFFFLERSNEFHTVTFQLDEDGAVIGFVFRFDMGGQITLKKEARQEPGM